MGTVCGIVRSMCVAGADCLAIIRQSLSYVMSYQYSVVPGLLESTREALLKSYQRVWHKLVPNPEP